MTMIMREYNRDQLQAIQMVRGYVRGLSGVEMSRLKKRIKSYLHFREDVAAFQKRYFSGICTEKCFTGKTSACCGREGIATFFADVVVNLILSSDKEVDALEQTLTNDRGGFKCVYLSESGCLWRLKPIVCEMFLCDFAKASVLNKDNVLGSRWDQLRRREKRYTWPDRPVLFDGLEEIFVQAGYDSPIMYFHHSPGLLRIKARFQEKIITDCGDFS